MKALTLIRPMAAAIVHGTKRIENRSRDLPRAMRGVPTVVAVHAGKKWDEEYDETVFRIDGLSRGLEAVTYEAQLCDEGIVGLMLLTGRSFTEATVPRRFELMPANLRLPASPWWDGPFGYEIARAVALPEAIPYPGALGWWEVDSTIVRCAEVRAALAALGTIP